MAKRSSKGSKKAAEQPAAWAMSKGPARSRIWTIATWITAVLLALLVAAAYLLLPDELPALLQRLLGLAVATLAVLVFVLATHQPEQDELMQRLQRGQPLDFGKQLRMGRKKYRTVKLPILGDTSLRSLGGTALFVAVAAWWFTPWAPVGVKGYRIKDLAIPLGEEVEAVILVLADGDLATPLPPVPPTRALKTAARIADDAPPYQRAMKAIVESRFDDARKLLTAALKTGQGDAAKIHVAQGQTELYACRFSEAVKWYENALELKPDDPAILCQAAVARMQAGDYQGAGPLAARAVEICRQPPAKRDARLGASLHVRAAFYAVCSQQLEEAEKLSNEVQEVWGKTLGNEHPAVAASLNNLAVLRQLRANYHGARNVNTLAYNAWAESLPAEHPYLAASRANLALLAYVEGRYADARKILDEVGQTLPNSVPSYHPAIALAQSQRALVELAQARSKEGLPRAEKALAALASRLGPEHPSVLPTLNTVAGFHAATAHYRKADHFHLRAVDSSQKVLGPEHPYLATSLNHLATVYLILRPLAQAEERGKQALAISQKAFGDKHPAVARDLRLLGTVESRKNDPDSNPRTLLSDALKIQQKMLDKKHPEIALTLGALAALDTSPRAYQYNAA